MASEKPNSTRSGRARQRGETWPLCFVAGALLTSTLLDGVLDATRVAREPHARDAPGEERDRLTDVVEPAVARDAVEPAFERMPDFDRMTVRELRQLPGLGEGRALAIVRARWQQGLRGGPRAFETLPGIGPATIEGLEGWLETRRAGASKLVPRAAERKLTRDDPQAAGPSDARPDSRERLGEHTGAAPPPR